MDSQKLLNGTTPGNGLLAVDIRDQQVNARATRDGSYDRLARDAVRAFSSKLQLTFGGRPLGMRIGADGRVESVVTSGRATGQPRRRSRPGSRGGPRGRRQTPLVSI